VLLKLECRCTTDVESVPSGFIVGEQHLCVLEMLRDLLAFRWASPQAAADRIHHVVAHLVFLSADGGAERHQQLRAFGSIGFQLPDRFWKNPGGHATPTGMTRCRVPCSGIGNQHWGAVGAAYPQALAALVAH
jgi:hypothetical protein